MTLEDDLRRPFPTRALLRVSFVFAVAFGQPVPEFIGTYVVF